MPKIDTFANVEREISVFAMEHVDPRGNGKIVDRLAQVLGVDVDPGRIRLGFPGTESDLAAVAHLHTDRLTASAALTRLRTGAVGFIRTCAKYIHP